MLNRLQTGIFLALFLLLSLSLLSGCESPGKAQPPEHKPAPPEVGVVAVKPQDVLLTTELSGRTSANLIAEVRPQVSGIIQKRLFTEGAKVKAGDLLYQIDPASYQATYDSATADLARSEARLTPARLKSERFRTLITIKAVSQQDFDDAEAAYKLAQADVAAAQAALQVARINLDYTRVKAPISGVIGRSLVTTGALVTAGQSTALATIQKLDPIFVDLTQSSTELLRMKRARADGTLKGGAGKADVKLILDDGSVYPMAGTLKFSDVTVNPGTGSVTLRTLFPNPDQLLLPGMYVRAAITEGVMQQALLVPQRGVTRNPAGEPLVMVVGAGEKVEPRVIQTTRTIGDNWLVTGGLAPGDRVILDGLQRIRPGVPVKAVPFEPSAPPQPVAAN